VPPDKPETEIVPEPACDKVPVIEPGEETAVYEVIVNPPFEPGAVNDTVAVVDPVAVAVPIVGDPGTDVLDLPYASAMVTAPEASPKRALTAASLSEI
jgi:hypothetical protein